MVPPEEAKFWGPLMSWAIEWKSKRGKEILIDDVVDCFHDLRKWTKNMNNETTAHWHLGDPYQDVGGSVNIRRVYVYVRVSITIAIAIPIHCCSTHCKCPCIHAKICVQKWCPHLFSPKGGNFCSGGNALCSKLAGTFSITLFLTFSSPVLQPKDHGDPQINSQRVDCNLDSLY